MKPEELWVGDRLKLKSSSEKVVVEGFSGHKLIVKTRTGNKELPWSAFFHETFNEVKKTYNERDSNPDASEIYCPDEIDLHIYDDHQIDHWLGAALHYQKNKCRFFLEKAEISGKPYIDFIHGIGSGVLKAEILNILEKSSLVKSVEHIHEGVLRAHLFR